MKNPALQAGLGGKGWNKAQACRPHAPNAGPHPLRLKTTARDDTGPHPLQALLRVPGTGSAVYPSVRHRRINASYPCDHRAHLPPQAPSDYIQRAAYTAQIQHRERVRP